MVAGSGAQQDGASASLTAPNGSSQRRLLLSVRAEAGAKAGDARYQEAHGTGTGLGDPIEVGSTVEVMARGVLDARGAGLACGSLKANLGHLEAMAAGGGLVVVTAVVLGRLVAPPSAQLRVRNAHLKMLMRGSGCWFGGEASLLASPRAHPSSR